jgi:hypothetical protein
MRRQVSANVQEALVRSYVSFKRWIVHILAVREGFKALDGGPTLCSRSVVQRAAVGEALRELSIVAGSV